MTENEQPWSVKGRVKWFDPSKGYGFVVADEGGPDVLLHANVLRNYGQSSVADNARIEIIVQKTQRGIQAIEVLNIEPPAIDEPLPLVDPEEREAIMEADVPLEPARVKWFDKSKGFGFANVFGRPEDIFLHIEVLRRSGFADLQPGEAICIKVIDGKRGRMAASVTAWDMANKKE